MIERTTHRLIHGDSRDLSCCTDGSAALVVTSPPYPMIEMWDTAFSDLDSGIATRLENGDGNGAFERMHGVLDEVWAEVYRILSPGGLACVNVGDATRTVDGIFRLYPNGARIVSACSKLGFDVLPRVLWRKSTNAPNKFMGSGMLPGGAYVTLEHEHVLIFRKGGKRAFVSAEEKSRRRRSAYFWEERNRWFSDLWTDVGFATQGLDPGTGRMRSGAFPVELPYRLVHMYSVQGDLVVDPFVGTGSTSLAALAGARSSLGVDVDDSFLTLSRTRLSAEWSEMNRRSASRIAAHDRFIAEYRASGREPKHRHTQHGYPVITSQEVDLEIPEVEWLDQDEEGFAAYHRAFVPPQ